MRRLLVVFALFWLVATALPAASIFPYKYQETRLENGLRVIMIPMKNQGLVSYFTIMHAGSRNEVEPGKSGFAHFFEHIMFRGTEKYPAEVYNQIVSEMGADTNAYTTDDFTAFYLHFPGKYLEKVIDLQSDRFMNLKYALPAFQTEAKAVLGEYNKDLADPFFQLEEKLDDTAFEKSSYKHTTMGFLRDVENMPNEYEYSLTFFKRFYRPDNATIVITGNFEPQQAMTLIKKYYSPWKPGVFKTQMPEEPPQQQEKTASLAYQGDTLPLLALGYKAPAFSPTGKDYAALALISELTFGETSPLYEKLVLTDQKVDLLQADYSPHVDHNLFTVYARLKKQEDLATVQEAISSTIEDLKSHPADPQKLTDIKSNLKYTFLMSLDTSKNTAARLIRYLELTRNIEGIDQLFQTYSSITPEDIQQAAQKYLRKEQRTVITLTGGK
jgi:zinc protease